MIGSRLWQVAGWTMLHYFWVGAALGAAALLVRQRLWPAAAGVRYLFALGSLALVSGAPAVIAVVVAQNLAPAAPSAPLPVDSVGQPEATRLEEMRATMAQPVVPLPAAAPASPLQAPLPIHLLIPERQSGERLFAALSLGAMWLPWLWVFGAPLSFALTTAGLLGAERLRRQSRPLEDARISEICRHLAISLKVSYRVSVAICDRIVAPILVGVLRPMILLPAAALAGWDPQQLEMVLLHELAHVHRHDNLVNLLQRIVESLLFFQPMVWILSGWVRREREHCCDELVIARTRQPQAYAEILVALAERVPQNTPRSSSLVHPRAALSLAEQPLIARIRRILKKEEQSMQVSRKSVGLVFMCVIVCALVIGGYYSLPSYADDSSAASKKPSAAASNKNAKAAGGAASTAAESKAAATFPDEPAAHALYNQMIEAMRKAKSLSYVSHYGRETGTDGCTYRMWLKKPNYFRAETECTLPNQKTHKKEEAGGVLIGDGNTLWIYWPHGRPRFTSGYRPLDSDAVYEKTRLNSYMKEPAPPGGHSIWHEMCLLGGMGFPVLEPSTFHGYTDCLQQYVDGVRSLGTEKIGDQECDKIEVSIMKHQRSWYLSLSRRDHLPRKLKGVTRVSHDIVTDEQWSSVTINGDIPNTMFAWKPPKGWKEWRLPKTEDRLLKRGAKAPDFEMASLDGKRIKLSDYRGRLVWLCIWRIGCPPCREEIPHLQEMYAKYKDQGLVVLGLNAADDQKLTVEFLRERGITFPNILDPSKTARETLARDYGHGGAVPTNYLIDRDGKIAEVLLGYGGEGDPRPIAALQKTGGELGKAIRQEWEARATQSAESVTAAAQRLFQALRAVDYDHFLKSGDWKNFPVKDNVDYMVDHNCPGWVKWICTKFKANPITDVRLGKVFPGPDGSPTVHFELRLKNGEVLQGDLPFHWDSQRKQWMGWEGLDWHLHSNPWADWWKGVNRPKQGATGSTLEMPAAAKATRRLGEIDVVRIQELHHLTDTFGERIWPGFDTRKTPVAVNNNDREELLVGHPKPPKEFHPFQSFKLNGQPVMIRDGMTRYGPRGGGWAIMLGGQETAYVSTLKEGQDTESYLSLLLHECFHCFQKDYRREAKGADGQLPEDDPVYSAMIGLESRVLKAALDEWDEKKARKLAALFVAVRQQRRKDMPKNLVLLEGEEEYSEGTATYSQARLFQLLIKSHGIAPQNKGKDPQYHGFPDPGKEYARMISQIIPPENGPISFFHAMYQHGMAQGLLLDRVRPGWKQEMREKGMTQFTLLAREFPLTENAGKELFAEAKNRFGYDDLLTKQTKLVHERLDLIRRYIDASGRHYRIYHGRTRASFKWKPAGPVYEVPESLEKELAEKRKKMENAAEKIASRRLVWAGGIRRFEKEGIVFQSGETPVIYGSEYLEWIDPHPRPDKSDMKIDSKKEVGGVYIGASVKTGGFTLEARMARVEWSKDLVKIYPVGAAK